MNQPKDPAKDLHQRSSAEPKPAAKAADGAPPAGKEKSSGRVGYDARGNSVWEWQLETGVYSRDVSTQKLETLPDGLSLADTAIHKQPEAGKPAAANPSRPGKAPTPGGGFNPYDNAAKAPMPGGGFNPYDSASGARTPPGKRGK
jgi:hypothetical protein